MPKSAYQYKRQKILRKDRREKNGRNNGDTETPVDEKDET